MLVGNIICFFGGIADILMLFWFSFYYTLLYWTSKIFLIYHIYIISNAVLVQLWTTAPQKWQPLIQFDSYWLLLIVSIHNLATKFVICGVLKLFCKSFCNTIWTTVNFLKCSGGTSYYYAQSQSARLNKTAAPDTTFHYAVSRTAFLLPVGSYPLCCRFSRGCATTNVIVLMTLLSKYPAENFQAIS